MPPVRRALTVLLKAWVQYSGRYVHWQLLGQFAIFQPSVVLLGRQQQSFIEGNIKRIMDVPSPRTLTLAIYRPLPDRHTPPSRLHRQHLSSHLRHFYLSKRTLK
jgi:hypothetical protein